MVAFFSLTLLLLIMNSYAFKCCSKMNLMKHSFTARYISRKKNIGHDLKTVAPEVIFKNNSQGEVLFKNTQKKYIIDKNDVLRQINIIRSILGFQNFEVSVWFCSDTKIRELNKISRGISKSTDILSLPAYEFSTPGSIIDDGTLQYAKWLGDLVISPAYVDRVCQSDKASYKKGNLNISDYEDAGVSKHMATEFNLTARIPMLLIHGMLHLIGYDHETDEDWATMTTKEEDVLRLYYEQYNSNTCNFNKSNSNKEE